MHISKHIAAVLYEFSVNHSLEPDDTSLIENDGFIFRSYLVVVFSGHMHYKIYNIGC